MTEADAAALLSVAVRTLQRWRTTGDGPPFVRLGRRRIGYRVPDLDRWTAGRSAASRSEEAARDAARTEAAA